jgi:excinuclease ABC subunit B
LDARATRAERRQPNRLARNIDVSPARVNDIVHGRSAITAPLALRPALDEMGIATWHEVKPDCGKRAGGPRKPTLDEMARARRARSTSRAE